MAKYHLRIYLLVFFFGFAITACSQLGLQSKKETEQSAPVPECKKNYAKEGNFISGRTYKTWVKYENLDPRRGFDAAVAALKSNGHRVTNTGRESGIIQGEMTFGSEDPKAYPIEISMVKEKTSLTVHLSSKSAVGSSAQETFCSFYGEFEKGIKRISSSPPPRQAAAPPKKPPEGQKESTPSPSPPPTATPKASPTPTPSGPSKSPMTQAQVVWGEVNLREGPGMNYKVIGVVKKGTSLGVLEEKKGWLQVRLEDGREAWISKAATSLGAKSSPASPPSRSTPSPAATPDASNPKSPM